MSRRSPINFTPTVSKPRPPLPFGLEVGDWVRYQRKVGGTWREMTVGYCCADGSITCFEVLGSTRSLMPERLEVKRRGPRGGSLWVPVVPEKDKQRTG